MDVKTLKFGEMYPLGNPDTARLAPSADRARTATDALIDMAGIRPGMRVLDLACGAGSQTIQVAKRVGPNGGVVASDISALTMCAEAPARRGWITLRLLNARQTTLTKISFGEMRDSSVRGLLVYCADYAAATRSRSAVMAGLFDIEPSFIRGARV